MFYRLPPIPSLVPLFCSCFFTFTSSLSSLPFPSLPSPLDLPVDTALHSSIYISISTLAHPAVSSWSFHASSPRPLILSSFLPSRSWIIIFFGFLLLSWSSPPFRLSSQPLLLPLLPPLRSISPLLLDRSSSPLSTAMGNTVSRDHAKLPFGYTHARKDHSFNTSSVAKRRFATLLLRTADTASVTPLPIQDGASSVASIPETVSLPPLLNAHESSSSSHPVHPLAPSGSTHHSSSSSSELISDNQGNMVVPDTAPESVTGAGTLTDIDHPPAAVPESDMLETSTRTAARARTTARSSLANSIHMGQTPSTQPDMAHAAPASSQPSSSARYEQESYSSIQRQRQCSLRTQEEQDSDMDIISALGIADQPYRGTAPSYDFFSGTASSPPCTSSQKLPSPPHQGQQTTLIKQDSFAMLVSGSKSLQLQGDYETRVSNSPSAAVRSDFRGHPSFSKRVLSYELKGSERELLQLQEEDEELSDSWDDGTLKLDGAGDTDSILDEESEHLSPIPFSDLPSLTNIGLCSHGIVKLSSNIRLLAAATCVQICCNELSRIPAEIGFLRNLTLLDLSKNRLTHLPESIIHLTKLVELKLSMNQLTSIPAGIGGLTKLAVLSLDNNLLESIPSQIGLIKGLVNLDLSDNPITVLPAEVGKLQFLRRLKLERCPLVEEFSHSPLHSPPTLLELAARVIVRHDVPMPTMLLPHLKNYIKSARPCTFCDGPYIDSYVKRGKIIEKNEVHIPLEYTLCQPHWNTELERIKLLFCKRPITSPPVKPSTAPQGPVGHIKVAKKQSAKSESSSSGPTTGGADSPGTSAGASTGAQPSATPVNGNRPGYRKYASEKPLSAIGNRLSTLLIPRADRRERPTSTYRTSSMPVVVSGTASSSSTFSSTPSTPIPSTPSSEEGEPVRPTPRRSATGGILARAAFKLKRPLSMASAFEASSVAVGHSDPSDTILATTD